MWTLEGCPTSESEQAVFSRTLRMVRRARRKFAPDHDFIERDEPTSRLPWREVKESLGRDEQTDPAPAPEDHEGEARIEYTRQRVRDLSQHPEIVALREMDDSGDHFLEENEALVQSLEAGEFRREAIIRRYGRAFADSLKHPGR